jgi:hypothetical protein
MSEPNQPNPLDKAASDLRSALGIPMRELPTVKRHLEKLLTWQPDPAAVESALREQPSSHEAKEWAELEAERKAVHLPRIPRAG